MSSALFPKIPTSDQSSRWNWNRNDPRGDFDECKKRVLCDGSKAPDLFELKDFWRFYKDQSIGRLGNHATARSLLARAKQFNAGYKRRTGSEIGEETIAEINHVCVYPL